MQPITGIIILGITIVSLGAFLIYAGYGTSMIAFWFGVAFVLIGVLYAIVLPVLTSLVTRQQIGQRPPPQGNNNANGPAGPGIPSTSDTAQSRPGVGSGRG
jgi:membrane protein implicated in regulation of membrane protease activity